MPRRPKPGQANSRPAAARPSIDSYWERRIAPFLAKWALPLALCLIAFASARVVSTYSELSLTSDEPAHLGCGLEYLAKHVYKFETQHPPLSRAMVALGPYLEGYRPAGKTEMSDDAVAAFYRYGNFDRTVFLMRLGILPFFLMACAVIYIWAAWQFGKPAALIATVFFTVEPNVLAHAGLATTDMALTACLGAAFLALLWWAASPSIGRGVLLGVFTALAVVSKFTALGYLPAAAVLALAGYLWVNKPGWDRLRAWTLQRLATFALAAAVCALTVWSVFWFSFGKVPGWSIGLPAPELFDGIRMAMRHNAEGHPAFLLGEYSSKGWWYFFPVALFYKTEIAMLVLLPVGLWAAWRHRRGYGWTPTALCLGVLAPAMTSHVNIGLRHILPIYFGFSILAALGVIELARRGRSAVGALLIPVLLIGWAATSSARQHPDYLAYFNEFAGERPDSILVDSDLDWGQGMRWLARRLRQAGAHEAALMEITGPARTSEFMTRFYGMPPIKPVKRIFPDEGWNVISPSSIHLVPGGGKFHQTNPEYTGALAAFNGLWYERVLPTEKVGPLLVYKIPKNFLPSYPVSEVR